MSIRLHATEVSSGSAVSTESTDTDMATGTEGDTATSDSSSTTSATTGDTLGTDSTSTDSTSSAGSTTTDPHPPMGKPVGGTCSVLCYDDLCQAHSARSECSSPTGRCRTVDCGAIVDCQLLDAEYCDVSQAACYPRSGRCETSRDCPVLSDHLASDAIDCSDDGFCTVQGRTPDIDGLYPRVSTLAQLERPASGELFAGDGEFLIAWESEKPALIFVASGTPTNVSDLKNNAVWVAEVQAGTKEVRWADGHDSSWFGDPVPLPRNEPLYVVVLIVEDGGLYQISAPVPFGVGTDIWRSPGDACNETAPYESAEVPGGCPHPTDLLACILGACQKLCVSDLDCGDSPTSCGPEMRATGLRYCE